MNKDMEKILELTKMFEEREKIMEGLRISTLNSINESPNISSSKKKEYKENETLMNSTIFVEKKDVAKLYERDHKYASEYITELNDIAVSLKTGMYNNKHTKRTDEELQEAILNGNGKINFEGGVAREISRRNLIKRQEELLEMGIKGFVVSKYLELDKDEYKKIIDSIPEKYKVSKTKEIELPSGMLKSAKDVESIISKNLDTCLYGENNYIEKQGSFTRFMKKVIDSAKEMIGIEMPNKLGNLLNEKAGIENPANKQKNKYTPQHPSPTR